MSKNFMDYDNATSLFTKLKTALGKKSTVTWKQLQVTGDKIAEITVSGVKQDIFSHSIVVSRMQMSGTHIADITIDGVKNEIFAPNGGSSGGHTIEDAAGTDLTQRDTLQFTGALKATDDSSNSKTVVTDDADTYTWEQWNALTPQQRAAIPKALVTGAPGVDGGIDATLFTKLWKNDDPTASFAAQTITLNSADYDFLMVVGATSIGGDLDCSIAPKGKNIYFNMAIGNGTQIRSRSFTYVNDTTLNVDSAYKNGSADNATCIPIAIYGMKETINLEFSAIAANVSTSADKCMLEDGVTSVQDVIGGMGQSVSVTADGIKTLKTLLNELFALIDRNKMSTKSTLRYRNDIYVSANQITGYSYQFVNATISLLLKIYIQRMTVSNSAYVESTADKYEDTTYTDISSTVPSSGSKITIYY